VGAALRATLSGGGSADERGLVPEDAESRDANANADDARNVGDDFRPRRTSLQARQAGACNRHVERAGSLTRSNSLACGDSLTRRGSYAGAATPRGGFNAGSFNARVIGDLATLPPQVRGASEARLFAHT
jgi:hypothetical protein